MNQVVLSGNLTADPEPKTYGQVKVVNFGLAVNDRVAPGKDKTTSFLNCAGFNKTAEIIVENFVKGSQLSIAGRLKQESYKDKDGNNVSKVQVIVDQILNIPARTSQHEKQTSNQSYQGKGQKAPF